MRARQSFPILHDKLTLHWYAECTWLFILKVHLRITNKPPTAKDSNTDLGRCRLTQSSVVLHVHGLLFSSSVLLFLFNFLYPLFILIPNFTPRSLSFFSLLFSHLTEGTGVSFGFIFASCLLMWSDVSNIKATAPQKE